MTDDTRTPTTQAVPTETVRLMEAWATVAGPDHVWAGNEPHPWIEDIEGGCAVQGCVVDRVDHYVPPGLHLSCLGCGAAGLEGPTYCATHGDWLCERCITAIRSGGAEARDATGLAAIAEAHRALLEAGRGYYDGKVTLDANVFDDYLAAVRAALAAPPPEQCPIHSNAHRPGECDATGLREALDAHWLIPMANVTCRCGWIGPNDADKDERWADHREQAVRAALEAAPQEPRWPSERDAAAVEQLAAAIDQQMCRTSTVGIPGLLIHDPVVAHGEQAIAILAALREGGERP